MLFPGFIWNTLIFYILISLVGSLIPINKDFSQPSSGIEIYVASNGVHTDFVVPIKNEIHDWNNFIREDEFDRYWNYATHLAFGWGDQGFYIKTPEWKDLRPGTALNAVLIPTPSAMHDSLWNQPEEDKLTKKICVTEDQYRILVSYIARSFRQDESGNPIKIADGYGQYDLFFDGENTFHMFDACNTWTNDGLKETGVRACWWTFYDRAILWQLNKIEY